MARRGLVLTWLLTLSTITSAQSGPVHAPTLPPAGAATQAGLAGPVVAPALAPAAAAAATVAAPDLTRFSGAPTGALARAMVEQTGELVKEMERRAVQLGAQRVVLNKRYLSELDAIDRLKNQRPSWRRDRELSDSLSVSFETANQLSAADRESQQVNLKLLSAQHAYLKAIDNELATRPMSARVQLLVRMREPLARQFTAAARRIVLPDLDLDPLADPEELDQREAELAASEAELNRLLVQVDAAAIESFAASQRTSTDPDSGAEAVHRARGAVAERLEQVKRMRAEIEARSKQLRGLQ